MKPNELRIGNLVDAITGVKEGEYLPVRVVKILDDGLSIDSDHKGAERKDYYMDMDGYRPIPLTDKWYEKCGVIQFEIGTDPPNASTRTGWFVKAPGSKTARIEIPEWIKHVHELQNWYYWHFAKTELEIKT